MEFALVLPLLLMLIVGMIEFGILFNAKLVITSAAREGARKAAVTSVEDDVGDSIEYALASLNANVSGPNSKAKDTVIAVGDETIYWYIETPEGETTGNPVYIYVRCRKGIPIPIINNLIGKSILIPTSAMMRIEHS